jgi:hypothetical protein
MFARPIAKITFVVALCATLAVPASVGAAERSAMRTGAVYVQLWEDRPGNLTKRDAPFGSTGDEYAVLKSTATGKQVTDLAAGMVGGKNSVRYKNLKPGTYEVETRVPEGYQQISKRIKRIKVKAGKVTILNFSFKKKSLKNATT